MDDNDQSRHDNWEEFQERLVRGLAHYWPDVLGTGSKWCLLLLVVLVADNGELVSIMLVVLTGFVRIEYRVPFRFIDSSVSSLPSSFASVIIWRLPHLTYWAHKHIFFLLSQAVLFAHLKRWAKPWLHLMYLLQMKGSSRKNAVAVVLSHNTT